MKCAAHPDMETSLSCSKCWLPICPKCLIRTPAGAPIAQAAYLSNLAAGLVVRKLGNATTTAEELEREIHSQEPGSLY